MVLVFRLDACPCILSYLRAAEVCSAEATELPVWKRPPVSVANGLCHPKALDPGSIHPTKPLRALAGTPEGRDNTECSLVDLFRGNLSTISPFHLSTLKDPVDPVIRVL